MAKVKVDYYIGNLKRSEVFICSVSVVSGELLKSDYDRISNLILKRSSKKSSLPIRIMSMEVVESTHLDAERRKQRWKQKKIIPKATSDDSMWLMWGIIVLACAYRLYVLITSDTEVERVIKAILVFIIVLSLPWIPKLIGCLVSGIINVIRSGSR